MIEEIAALLEIAHILCQMPDREWIGKLYEELAYDMMSEVQPPTEVS